jgi:hypothetical protein
LASINTVFTSIQPIVTLFAAGINVSVELGPTVLRLSVEARATQIDVCLCACLRITLGSRTAGPRGATNVYIGLSASLRATCIGTGLCAATRLLGNRPTRHGKRQDACG